MLLRTRCDDFDRRFHLHLGPANQPRPPIDKSLLTHEGMFRVQTTLIESRQQYRRFKEMNKAKRKVQRTKPSVSEEQYMRTGRAKERHHQVMATLKAMEIDQEKVKVIGDPETAIEGI